MTNKNKPSIEAAFAIGRPARTSAHKTCSRCKGTGWWALGRQCFKCGGIGHAEVVTLATQIRDKRKHLGEVRGIVADLETRLAPGRRVIGRSQLEPVLASRRAQVEALEAELVALEVKAVLP